jgi:hypothetical protein
MFAAKGRPTRSLPEFGQGRLMKRFSPSDAALEGFRLTREHPGSVLAWGAIYFVGLMLIALLMVAGLGSEFIQYVQEDGLSSGDAQVFGAMLGHRWPAFVAVVLLAVFLISVLLGGVYRLVLRPEERGFVHLRFGRDELRLTAVNLILFSLGSLCLAVLAFAANVVQAGVGPGLLATLVGFATVGLMIWIGVRLSLATPMSFGERRIAIRASWRLTQGHFWSILGMLVLAFVFWLMIWALISLIGLVLVALAGGQAAIQDPLNLKPAAILAFLAYFVIQLILPVVQVITFYAPLAVAYRAIGVEPPDEGRG